MLYAIYDELYNILASGGYVMVDWEGLDCKDTSLEMFASNLGDVKTCVVTWCLTDIGLVLHEGYNWWTILFPNGSHNLEPAPMPMPE